MEQSRHGRLYILAGLGVGLVLLAGIVLAVGMFAATNGSVAQDGNKGSPPSVAMPNAEKITLLVRTALLTLNNAVQSGNYTVLRDTSAPGFREANSPAQLARTFSSLEAQNIELSAVAIMVPQLTETPALENNLLRIKGYFPGQPVRIDFDLLFQVVDGYWKLFGLSVNPVSSSQLPGEASQSNPSAE